MSRLMELVLKEIMTAEELVNDKGFQDLVESYIHSITDSVIKACEEQEDAIAPSMALIVAVSYFRKILPAAPCFRNHDNTEAIKLLEEIGESLATETLNADVTIS